MKFTLLRLTLLAAVMLTPALEAKPKKVAHSSTEGVASFYSTRFDGRVTASGQRFNSKALTAASLQLPLGSRVKITNLANHHSVIVRVNDRGPFVKGRDISVTRRAAQQLGFIKAGTAKVRITRLS
jgi:rare lipoprotein A